MSKMFLRLIHLLFLFCMTPQLTMAHSLGIDPADLTEFKTGQYALNAQVPPDLQNAISAPILPERCSFTNGPAGIASATGIRYEFTCQPGLNVEDEIRLPWLREGVLLTATWADGSEKVHLIKSKGNMINIALKDFSAGSTGFVGAAQRYTFLGVEHILFGIDHLLFVLALMIMVGSGWRLVKTITAFTIAHSLTLGLATLGFLSVPSAPTEAAIALSIVFICVEIVYASQGRRGLTYAYPWIVSFAFGLLHGLGFAGALSEIGLPVSEIPIALLFFNIGVELGQLLFVVAVLALITGLARLKVKFPLSIQLTPVYLIGVISTFWFLQRAWAIVS